MTLEEGLRAAGGKAPGFHLMRHVLSLVILLHHASALTVGVEPAPAPTKGDAVASLGALLGGGGDFRQAIIELLRPFLFSLVGSFFVLSGFLVAGSALRTQGAKRFLAYRALRILPALATQVLLTALILGPLATTLALSDYFADPRFAAYFATLAGFVHIDLPGVFAGNPIPDQVNSSLWTIGPEFCGYLMICGLMASGLVARPRWLAPLFAAATALALAFGAFHWFGVETRQDTSRLSQWLIVYLMMVGVALFAAAKYVPLDRTLFLASGVAYVALMASKADDALATLFLAYCVVYIGATPFPRFDRWAPFDLSYGIYIYGFPISQTLLFALGPHLASQSLGARRLVIMALTLAVTLPVAYLSWTWIEKPALGLKRLFGARAAEADAVSAAMAPAE